MAKVGYERIEETEDPELAFDRAMQTCLKKGYSQRVDQPAPEKYRGSQRGGGQTGLILPDLRQLRITRLTQKFELLISDLVLNGHSKVTESFTMRKQSKHLLECAKRAVEIAIEQDEGSAMQWLEAQTREQFGYHEY